MADAIETLTIRFPARPGYLAIGRLNATAMAARVGFDVDQLDDLRLAVDEAVTWLVGDPEPSPATVGTIQLTIACQPGLVEFRGRREDLDHTEAELDDLVGAILGATVDEIEVDVDSDGRRRINLVKRSMPDG